MSTAQPPSSGDFFSCVGQVRAVAESLAAQYARSHAMEVTLLLDCTGEYYITNRTDWDPLLYMQFAQVHATGMVETIVPEEAIRRSMGQALRTLATLCDRLVVLRDHLRVTGKYDRTPRLLRYSTATARALAKLDEATEELGDVRAWVQAADIPLVPKSKEQ